MAPGDQRRARPRLQVSASDERGRPLGGSLARWLSGVAPARARGAVTVAVVNDARVRALNRQYRKKDYATDVLSFPTEIGGRRSEVGGRRSEVGGRRSDVGSSTSEGGGRSAKVRRQGAEIRRRHLGDIVIARGVARRQARAAGHAETVELRVLALHGLLHLLGYDHEQDSGQMARLEKRLRRKGGLREGLIERQ
jgi:probable rRNA maturation factor